MRHIRSKKIFELKNTVKTGDNPTDFYSADRKRYKSKIKQLLEDPGFDELTEEDLYKVIKILSRNVTHEL